MATAEELLNGHEHPVTDFDAYFIIDPITRKIENTSGKTILMQYDHNCERFTFEIPRINSLDGHDMSQCNVVQIHYLNATSNGANKTSGVYEVDDLRTSADENADTVLCSWLISRNATQYVGTLSFVVRFACVSDNGTVDYAWSTAVYSGISVSSGIYNGDVVVEEYADILEQWRQELFSGSSSSGTTARIGYVDLLASAWVGEVSPYSQVVEIDGVTENSQVDLTPSVEQLAVFYNKDLCFVTENDNGVVSVYAIGQKPANDYTIQVTITEVAHG